MEDVVLTRDITLAEHRVGVPEAVEELHVAVRKIFGSSHVLDHILGQHGGRGAKEAAASAIGPFVFLLVHSLSSGWPLLGESLVGGSIHAKVETLDVS